MADESPDDLPEPTGPWFSSVGPDEGYLLAKHQAAMGVMREPGGWPVGIAWPAGSIASRGDRVQVWRLEVRPDGGLKGPTTPLEGRWVCRNREFIRLGDAAEEL